MAWTRQVVPFHRSASPTVVVLPPLLRLAAVAARPPAEPIVTEPTAVQAPVAAQDTARSSLPVAPAGLGVPWMRQRVPFHRSASITPEPPLAPSLPARLAPGAALPDVPHDRGRDEPAGAGVTWTRQLVPSHRSASGTLVPELPRLAPPAVHAFAEVQDTSKNSATADPAGLGVAWTRQLVPSHRSASAVVPVASVWA